MTTPCQGRAEPRALRVTGVSRSVAWATATGVTGVFLGGFGFCPTMIQRMRPASTEPSKTKPQRDAFTLEFSLFRGAASARPRSATAQLYLSPFLAGVLQCSAKII